MKTTIITIILLVIAINLKWLIFAICTPLIFTFQKRRKKKYQVFCDNTSYNDNSYYSTKNDNQKKTNKIKSFIGRYLGGYIRYIIINIGLIPSHNIRNFIYRRIFLADIEKNAIIYYGAEIRDPEKLKIGKGSIIGDKSILDARSGLVIGENVNLSSKVSIYTLQHDHQNKYFHCNIYRNNKVTIKNRVWIGPNCIILPGVTINEGAVIAAGAVVTKDIEAFSINAGIPAKKVNTRTQDLEYIFDGKNIPFL